MILRSASVTNRPRGRVRAAAMQAGESAILSLFEGRGAAQLQRRLWSQLLEAPLAPGEEPCVTWLEDADGAPGAGSLSALLMTLRDGAIAGASVGACQARWMARGEEPRRLTWRQFRSPLLGSREAAVVGFEAPLRSGRLVLGSEALWSIPPEGLQQALREADAELAAARLRELLPEAPTSALIVDVELAEG